ncbi:ribosome quality control complex subunit NEMF-like [Saccostrea echinata]|uniref:ribosome quality control complex subunit NEMF-like n=1 Tax=Saccostrea echinata TaxID=191078 RepID=UPI002A80423A|nr:ribosome quality control complex subunit NEMF-like [Saccostrea echinata]
MKSRFSTVDITVVIKELKRFYGMRVVNVYDVDSKTYLIKLGKPDDKAVILIESGIRIHGTEYDWPKNMAPSGFSMKLRKHIKGRRLENICQLGMDRIVDLQFGSGEAAYHVILELYDRGNVVLTDFEYTILNILRPRTDTCQDVKFAVRETYPISAAKQHSIPSDEKLREVILAAKVGEVLKKVLLPHIDYGPALTEHCLQSLGFPENVKVAKGFSITEDMDKLKSAIEMAESLLETLSSQPCQGVIIQKKERRAAVKDGEQAELLTYEEFHPMLFKQFENKPHCMFDNFNKSVDEFFSQLESQKLDMKVLQQEKSALKKLENIKKDHEKRIEGLQKEQGTDINKGRLIELNLPLVDQALLIVRSALANQIDWTEIQNLVKEAQLQGDPVASCITGLKLESNIITLLLRDPYRYSDDEFDDEDEDILKPTKVDIDISMSAYGNSRKYFDKKKSAAKKEQKTIDASAKALKSAERKTKETLKEVATAATINKTRKTYWFEKFLWFITSENYLVIGGRDQQQNEMIVKRYLRPGDLYIHADLHGASSCVLKNPSGEPVPPKSLNEAGTMAICNSVAWDAKVVTSAWWVYHDQVSKTAPSGEYLTTGSFMVRGKKNYLPPTHLVYGFGLMFKLEDGSIERHKGERKVHVTEDDSISVADSLATESDITADTNSLSLDSDSESEKEENDQNDNNSEYGENSERLRDDFGEIDSTVDKASALEGKETSVKSENRTGGSDDNRTDMEVKVEEEDETESLFPDTAISLQHVKGDKFELQRERSSTNGSIEAPQIKETMAVDKEGKSGGRGAKVSAKQRREMKKAKKAQNQQKEGNDDEEDSVSWLNPRKGKVPREDMKENQPEDASPRTEPQEEDSSEKLIQIQPKRGQRSKMKKIKEKYGDQDEEERQLRMEILASAGSKKEDKKKKGKKGQDQPKNSRPVSAKQQLQQQKGKGQTKSVDIILKPTAEIIIEDSTTVENEKQQYNPAKQEKADSDDERQEEDDKPDDVMMLDSLTGCPVPEDELLYAVPVCAPYSTMLNYKFKVKLTPGSTKRGKAAKLALNMFSHEKSTSSREKDLIRILKDADTSRNIPGKVKVSAPNLHKKKGK